jgi:aminopeptidase N
MTTMTPITLSPIDRAQVKAILRTHAEMQDRSLLSGEEVIARLKRDEPESELLANMIEDAAEILEDTTNLKRLADLF